MLGVKGLTLAELAQNTWQEAGEDNLFGRAAELAYYFLLALFPLLIFLLSLISFIPDAQETIFMWLARLMPKSAVGLIDEWVRDVFDARSGGLLSFGMIFSLWAASNGMAALIAALNSAYEVKEARPFWKARLVALGLTVALSLLVFGGAFAIAYGDRLAAWISGAFRLGADLEIIWTAAAYLVGLFMIVTGLALIYCFAPNARQRWRWLTHGSVFAAVAFIAVSYLFSLYLRFAPSYSVTYGSIGAVIVLMLWLYLMGLIVLIGGEINSEINKARGKQMSGTDDPQFANLTSNKST